MTDRTNDSQRKPGRPKRSQDPADIGAAGLGRSDDDTVVDEPGVQADAAADRAAADGPHDEEIEIVEYSEDVPFELREEAPAAGREPKTGLVAEFRELSGRQAAWLVSNRETGVVSRSPLFYVTALVIGLAVIAGLIIGVGQKSDPQGGETTLATVGAGDQAAMIEQQLGIKVQDVQSVEEAQKLVREHRVDAAYVSDPTGQGEATLIALNSEPTAVMEKLQPKMNVTYLEQPAVKAEVAVPLAWAMGGLALAAILTLGAALYGNLRTERRNRITEILAATISPRAAAWGRVWGLTVLSLGYLVIAAGVALLGMSIIGETDLAVAMLPGLGWFAGLYLCTVFLSLALFLWAGTLTGKRAARFLLGLTVVLAVAGVLVPMVFAKSAEVLRILSYIPFASTVAMPLRIFANQAQWWEALIAVAIALVAGLIVFAAAAAAYRANLLRGTGRAGKAVTAKKARKAKAGDAKNGAAKADAAPADAAEDESATAEDADAKTKTKAKAKPSAGGTSAAAKGAKPSAAADE